MFVMMKLIIGSDHAGYAMKKAVKRFLSDRGIDVVDAGTNSEASVDYTDFGIKVAKEISEGKFEEITKLIKEALSLIKS